MGGHALPSAQGQGRAARGAEGDPGTRGRGGLCVRRPACLRAWIARLVLLGAGLTELGVVLPRRRRGCLRARPQLGGGARGWPGGPGRRGRGGLPQAAATRPLPPTLGHHPEASPDPSPPSRWDLLAVVATAAAGCVQATSTCPAAPAPSHWTPCSGTGAHPALPRGGGGPRKGDPRAGVHGEAFAETCPLGAGPPTWAHSAIA